MSTILREIMKQQGLIAKTNYSVEEIEELEVEVAEEVELVADESDEIDGEFEEIEQVEEAATSLEAMADFLDTELTGLSQEGYVHLMEAGNAVLSTARIYNQEMMSFSAEDGESESKEARKASAADKFRAKAGGLKDAAIEAIKRLFRTIQEFFAKFFDRIEKVKKAAAAKASHIGNGEGAKAKLSIEWAKQYGKMGELLAASKDIGHKAVDAVKSIKADGDATTAFSKLSAVSNHKIPAGLVGNPTWGNDGKLSYELPAVKGGTTAELEPVKVKAALNTVVEICDDILKQRKELKGSVLTEQEKRMSSMFAKGDDSAAKEFAKFLKLVNGIYKGWTTYVGKVCAGVVGAISANSKVDQDAA